MWRDPWPERSHRGRPGWRRSATGRSRDPRAGKAFAERTAASTSPRLARQCRSIDSRWNATSCRVQLEVEVDEGVAAERHLRASTLPGSGLSGTFASRQAAARRRSVSDGRGVARLLVPVAPGPWKARAFSNPGYSRIASMVRNAPAGSPAWAWASASMVSTRERRGSGWVRPAGCASATTAFAASRTTACDLLLDEHDLGDELLVLGRDRAGQGVRLAERGDGGRPVAGLGLASPRSRASATGLTAS